MNECVKTSVATEDHFEVNFTDESAVIEIPNKLKVSKSEIIDW